MILYEQANVDDILYFLPVGRRNSASRILNIQGTILNKVYTVF